jgi:hypothetical protein
MGQRYIAWLSTYPTSETATLGLSGDLWVRPVVANFLPRVGERMAMLASEEEPEGDLHTPVVEVYYDLDGYANVTMQGILVDPSERQQDLYFRGVRSDNPRNGRSAWYTDRDGDLIARLRESGWLTYAEFTEAEKARARR